MSLRMLLVCSFAASCTAAPADGHVAGDPATSTSGSPVADAARVPQTGAPLLGSFDFSRRTARFDLPGRLDEVSGLAMTPDGRLFAHGDEEATVHEIDTSTGEVGKRFSLGERPVPGDFEGMAVAGERFFLVTSGGFLYEFREADDRQRVEYRVTDTRVGSGCEVEGLDYDPDGELLLLACKRATPERGVIVVHRLPLDPARPRMAPIRVDRAQLAEAGLSPSFQPSAVLASPAGTVVLVSATEEALIEVDAEGRLLEAVQLSKDRHGQPEGLELGLDGTLFVADEENDKDARLTIYAPAGGPEGRP